MVSTLPHIYKDLSCLKRRVTKYKAADGFQTQVLTQSHQELKVDRKSTRRKVVSGQEVRHRKGEPWRYWRGDRHRRTWSLWSRFHWKRPALDSANTNIHKKWNKTAADSSKTGHNCAVGGGGQDRGQKVWPWRNWHPFPSAVKSAVLPFGMCEWSWPTVTEPKHQQAVWFYWNTL